MLIRQLENGRYICPTCGLSWENLTVAQSCCENLYQPPEEVAEINPSGIVELPDEGATVTYADTVPEPVAAELLGRAARHMHDRAATYDEPGGERSMGKAVAAFNAITGRDLTESEGWLLLQVLKDVRLYARSGYHADSAEDCIAYAALKAEAKSKGL